MDISVLITLNQLLEVFFSEIKFSKKKKEEKNSDKTSFVVTGPFCTPYSICLANGLLGGTFCQEILHFQSVGSTKTRTVFQVCKKGLRFPENLFQR